MTTAPHARATCEAGPHAAVADAVMSNITGQRDAQRAIFAIREGCAPADALLDAFEILRGTGDADRLRGFARELQKAIERSSGSAA